MTPGGVLLVRPLFAQSSNYAGSGREGEERDVIG